MPHLDLRDLPVDASLAELAVPLLEPFFVDDEWADALPQIAAQALDFPAPVRTVSGLGTDVLELFHGPTAAFKDFGARFLARCMQHMRGANEPPLTIVVATSGDTGAAVAAAFHDVPGFRVCILYPDGRVSPRQAHQLGCFGGNVRTMKVAGSFDDCQKLAKRALADQALKAQVPLSSANSISLGRLLPQMIYYAQAALAWHKHHGQPADFIVPTGNLGNALACAWVRALGLPVWRIHLAANANTTVPEFFSGAPYRPRASIATLANAMDVGAPSNFERLQWLHAGDDAAARSAFTSTSSHDGAIAATIREMAEKYQYVVGPHTATAVHAMAQLRAAGDQHHWTLVATAHPAKFNSIVEPLIGHEVPVPPALDRLLQRPSSAEPMAVDYAALCAVLEAGSA